MLRPSRLRNTTNKPLLTANKSYGPNLMFKWSIAGANSSVFEDDFSFTLPSIDTNRMSNQSFKTPSRCTGHQSSLNALISNNKSTYSSSLCTKHKSPRLIDDDRSSKRSSPVSISYEQLQNMHQTSPSSMKISKQNSVLLQPIVDNKSCSILFDSTFDENSNSTSFRSISDSKEKLSTLRKVTIEKQKPTSFPPTSNNKRRNSISSSNSKVSSNSKKIVSSMTTVVPTVSKKHELRLSHTEFVRLQTPQLRRLNVSEKYMAEAKKLYFNAYCKSFVPRIRI